MTVPNKVGCIGAGYWGKNLVRNFNDLKALSWICEVDPAVRAGLAAKYPTLRLTDQVDLLLSDPELRAVAIATPAESHGKLVRRALMAGKDVFVEKPLGLSTEEGQQLIQLGSEKGRILMVGHLLWYHPAVLRLKELIDEGELGRIR